MMILNPERRDETTEAFEEGLKKLLIGQERAVKYFADLLEIYRSGLTLPSRPIGNVLLLGPTGSGKTRLVEAAASVLFGGERAFIKIDCGEFQHSHEIAKLTGSPPGYIGHRETEPALTQEAIDCFHTDQVKLTLVLFDEIEKASDALWKLMLGILDKATLTLGDNRRVNFSKCIIVMTSNLGGSEISRMMTGGKMGFSSSSAKKNVYSDDMEQEIWKAAREAAKRKFPPEFMNRIDKMIVFRPLKPEHLEKILDVEMNLLHKRIIDSVSEIKFVFRLSEGAKKLLIDEGTSTAYGARPLKRAIDRFLVRPLARLMSTKQISLGDLIQVDLDEKNGKRLTFSKEKSIPGEKWKTASSGSEPREN